MRKLCFLYFEAPHRSRSPQAITRFLLVQLKLGILFLLSSFLSVSLISREISELSLTESHVVFATSVLWGSCDATCILLDFGSRDLHFVGFSVLRLVFRWILGLATRILLHFGSFGLRFFKHRS